MRTFEKIYIGKGKKIQGLDIVRVSCKLEDLQAIAYEKDGIQYVTFEVARMKATDAFDRTHCVYYSKMVEKADTPEMDTTNQIPDAQEIKTKKGKRIVPVKEPLPF